jgi:elongation factor G
VQLAPLEWNQHKLNVIDVPGYFDFVGEMAGALRVVDSACIVVGAVSGVIVGTEKAWDYCKEYGIPRLFLSIRWIGKMPISIKSLIN